MQSVALTESVRCKKTNTVSQMFRSSPSPALRCRVETRRRSSAKHRGHSEKRSEVLEQTYQSRRRRRSRSVTQGSAGSDNTSTIISDEGTHVDTLEKNGTNFFSLTEDSGDLDESVTDDTLWILENNSIQDREPVVCVLDDQNLDVVEVGSVKDKDDSFDSLSWTSTASGPTLLEDKRPLVPCQNCAKLFTKMKKVKRWKKIIDYDPASLSCDQWVLNKRWKPSRPHNLKGRLWVHLSRIRKRIFSCVDVEQWNESQACSRPHVFLQRNLRRCRKSPASGRRQREQHLAKGKKRAASASLTGQHRRGAKKKRSRMGKAEGPEVCLQGTSSQGSNGNTGHDSTWNQVRNECSNRVCRVLDFDMGEPEATDHEGPSVWCQYKNGLQQNSEGAPVRQRSKVRGANEGSRQLPDGGHQGHFSWVQKGGFRSLLAELESNRSTVIQEL
ncbi:uncharacterized protein LOC108928946 isoform X2 [Scleropages formosus]|nr:uncharacterized protein LOC108928946 isoform X2 [Scleropages formosus]